MELELIMLGENRRGNAARLRSEVSVRKPNANGNPQGLLVAWDVIEYLGYPERVVFLSGPAVLALKAGSGLHSRRAYRVVSKDSSRASYNIGCVMIMREIFTQVGRYPVEKTVIDGERVAIIRLNQEEQEE